MPDFLRGLRRGNSTSSYPNPAPASPPIAVRPIGVVRNGVRRPRPSGWESVVSQIVLDPDLAEGLRGIEGFSHVIVLTWLHLAAAEPRELLAIHPGGDPALPLVGIFALRVAGRPNPIGCSVVRLLPAGPAGGTPVEAAGSAARRGPHVSLTVRGLDAVDGTPVLDLKPYLPAYDSVPEALLPGWALPG